MCVRECVRVLVRVRVQAVEGRAAGEFVGGVGEAWPCARNEREQNGGLVTRGRGMRVQNVC